MTSQIYRDQKTDYLLTSENAALVLIDFQPMLVDGTKSQSKESLVNNVVALAKAGKLFELPIVLSSVESKPAIKKLRFRNCLRYYPTLSL